MFRLVRHLSRTFIILKNMYVVVNKEKLEGRYFGVMNELPDGRVYIPISEMRQVGSLLGVDIIGSARELKGLISVLTEKKKGGDR